MPEALRWAWIATRFRHIPISVIARDLNSVKLTDTEFDRLFDDIITPDVFFPSPEEAS